MAGNSDTTSPSPHPLASGLRGLHHSLISTANQRAVLMLVATSPGITNAEIARRSGLGAQTVSRFLSDLEKEGLIRRGEVKRGQPGLPATPYSLVHGSVVSLGVSIGWRCCDVVLMDMAGTPRLAETIRYEYPRAEEIFARVGRIWQRFNETPHVTGDERRLIGGVAVPEDAGDLRLIGVSDSVCSRWRDIDAAQRLSEATGLHFRSYGLGRAAAWAEHAGPGSPWGGDFLYVHIDEVISSGIIAGGSAWRDDARTDFLYVHIDEVISSGIIAGGSAWRGSPSGTFGSRFGRMLAGGTNDSTTTLQDIASVAALRKRAAASGIAAPDGADEREHLFSTKAAEGWMEDAAAALAWACANIGIVIGIRRAVIGGWLPQAALLRLCDAVSRRMEALRPSGSDAVSVGCGLAGPAAAAIGASYLPVYDEFFSREPTA